MYYAGVLIPTYIFVGCMHPNFGHYYYDSPGREKNTLEKG